MSSRDWVSFNREIVGEFRANGGQIERFGGLPVVILHTIGAVTGEVRLTPLIPIIDGDDMFVFATAAGASKDPAWVANLRANPRITVESADDEFVADVCPNIARRRAADDRRTRSDDAAARRVRVIGSATRDPRLLHRAGSLR